MSTAARRRLMRDFKRLQEDPPMGVSGAPGENNIMIWNAVIFGEFANRTFSSKRCHTPVKNPAVLTFILEIENYIRLSFPFRAT